MKKVVFVLMVFVSLTRVANAQKGTTLLYGNAKINSSSSDGVTQTGWEINPGFGYQFQDNWTAGIDLGVGGRSTTGLPIQAISILARSSVTLTR